MTDGPQHFEGFLMRDLLELVGAKGEIATAHALNDYVIDIPMSDFERFDVLVAMKMNGRRLTARDKGPLWIVYPRDDVGELQDIRYDYRWVWQLDSLTVQ
ncbi:molybdopterin-dependent oxidoreductase [Roseibium salinum]|uniref:molybdopterin-dependent oxidoreductase n=1 Tax=Roseibium salinum TaxID=1604349 RepID=UPI003671A946